MDIEHINAQSLLCYLNEICLLVIERQPDIFCVSETWLTNDVLDHHIAISDYNVYRRNKGRDGVVCMNVKNIFTVTVIDANSY